MRKKAKVKEQENLSQENLNQETSQEVNQNPIQTSYDSEPDYEKLLEMKNELESQEVETEKTQKKKRGRPKKSEIEIESIPEIDFSIILDLLISRMPNPIPLSETEKKLVNDSANKVFRKYFDNVAYSDEITLGIVIFTIIYPRLKPSRKSDE